jgi:hypothetical protein
MNNVTGIEADANKALMWNMQWIIEHRDELGPFGSGVLQGLEEGMPMRAIASRFFDALSDVKPTLKWRDLTAFERVVNRLVINGCGGAIPRPA